MSRKLTPTELLKIQVADLTEENAKLKAKLHQKDIEAKTLTVEIHKKNARISTLLLTEANKMCYTDAIQNAEKARQEVMLEIAANHELEGGWGYDPATGEIV